MRFRHTAWRRLREWQDAGVWDRLHQLVLDELSDIDELDWTRGCIDAVSVTAGRAGHDADRTSCTPTRATTTAAAAAT